MKVVYSAQFLIILIVFAPFSFAQTTSGTTSKTSVIPSIGNMSVQISISGATMPASFSNGDVTASSTMTLDSPQRQIGTLSFQVSLKNFTGGTVELASDALNTQGSFSLNAINDTFTIDSLSIGQFSHFGNLQAVSSGGYGRELYFNVQQGGMDYGKASLKYGILDPTTTASGSITLNGNNAGSISVTAQATPLIDQFDMVTNMFAGFVTSKTGNPITSGTIRAVSAGTAFTIPVTPVGEKGGYGFKGKPLLIHGIVGAPVQFFYGDYQLEKVFLTSQGNVRKVDLVVPVVTSGVNFPDWDLDGVPDAQDQCPDSKTTQVDATGCTCEQILTRNNNKGTCEYIPGKGPKYTPPAPPPPPKPQCEKPEKCLTGQAPKYCTANKTIENNCDVCGCPTGFDCNPCPEGQECITDGGCYKVVEQTGLRCLKNKYQIGVGLNCTAIGSTYLDFFEEMKVRDPTKADLASYVLVEVDTDFFGGDTKPIKEKLINNLRRQKICIDTVDYGCVAKNAKCPGEYLLAREFPEVANALAAFESKKTTSDLLGSLSNPVNIGLATGVAMLVGSPTGLLVSAILQGGATGAAYGAVFGAVIGAVVGLIGAFLSETEISYKLNYAAIKETPIGFRYTCAPLLLSQNATCTPFLEQADPEQQIDILFIGDGYAEEELNTTVTQLLDYRGNASGTKYEGLFSRQPLKNNKGRFNIWTTIGNITIAHAESELKPASGKLPNVTDVQQIALGCPQQDYTVVVSKNEYYQSDCSFEGTQPCYLSMKDEPFPGRELMRLFAKAFAGLGDEYYYEITAKEIPHNRVSNLDNVALGNRPNCKSLQDAQSSDGWKDKITAGKVIGFFEGCGGECGSTCENYYRPTFNSPMRNSSMRCTDVGQCSKGPPFDSFFIVNEEALIKALQDFGEEGDAAAQKPVTTTEPESEPAKPATPTNRTTTPANATALPPKTHTISIEVFAFSTPSLTIKKGDTVVWRNKDSTAHTATGQGVDTGTIAAGGSKTVKFDTAGTFSYSCNFHPEMKGTITVE
ncbi:cupredoxin domain-containing protein [Candidatus Woesearchaeota archaeon]|nr:cupredoxin domain-containing protein [Candidatus Woesearchaeota archaeon]